VTTWLTHQIETEETGVVRERASGEAWSFTWRVNPLGGEAEERADALLEAWEDSIDRAVVWSGSGAASLFERDPASWGASSREAFERFSTALEERLSGSERRVLFRPHARHVLGDPQTCLTFLRERAGERFGLALDPFAMLEAEMLERSAEHLTRAFEALGDQAEAIWLDASDGAVVVDPATLDQKLVRRLLHAHAPPETARIVEAEGVEAAIRRWAGGTTDSDT
jgi:hypothetical protein